MPDLIALPKITHPGGPCPPWCQQQHGLDDLDRDGWRHHLGPVEIHLAEVDGSGGETVRVELSRLDTRDGLGQVGILTARREVTATGEPCWRDLLGVPIDLGSAERLAQALLDAVRTARAGGVRADRPVPETSPFGRGVPTLVCVDCGDQVQSDSTPDLDRCWRCAERADEENDR